MPNTNINYPPLNFLHGGLTTDPRPTKQYRPILILARSPLIITPDCSMTLPLSMMFCEP